MSYVADVTPADRLGHAYGRYTMALYSGMTLGPAAGGYVAAFSGLREVFLVVGGLLLVMLVVAYRYLPAPPAHPETSGSLCRKRPVMPSLALIIQNRPFVACLVATLGCCLGYGMFVTFMPLYMKSMGMNTVQVGYVFTAQALANALSRLPTGKLADRIGDKGLLIGSGLALFSLALACFAVSHAVATLMVVAVVMGVSMGIAFTVICAQIADLVPAEMRGLAVGCYNTSVYTGMMLSSVVMGPVIRVTGFASAFVLNGSAGMVVLCLFIYLFRQKKPDDLVAQC
jgi:DHA1 family multidrug resistance protein-like MFS transporter